MKIYTRVEIDTLTGEVLHAESFDYHGPLALCEPTTGAAATTAAKAGPAIAANEIVASTLAGAELGGAALGAAELGGAALGTGAAELGANVAGGFEAETGTWLANPNYAPASMPTTPLSTAIQTVDYSAPLTAPYSTPAVPGAVSSTAATFSPAGVLGGAAVLPAVEGASLLERGLSAAKDIYGNPVAKAAMQAGSELYKSGQAEKAQGAAASRAAEQARSFNDQLSALIKRSNDSAVVGSSATAVPLGERVGTLYGPGGGTSRDPAGVIASMAPAVGTTAPTGGAVAGTPSAPSMPNNVRQGAVKIDRTRMYA